jgi:hypothetical protein
MEPKRTPRQMDLQRAGTRENFTLIVAGTVFSAAHFDLDI